MTERRSSVPDYNLYGHTFECWVIDNGQSHVWRSGPIEAGRTGKSHWVRVGGVLLGTDYPSLKQAMRRGVDAVKGKVAA